MTYGKRTNSSRRILAALAMTLGAAGLLAATAQQPREEEATRSLWDTAFINDRPASAAARRKARRNYRIVTPRVRVAGVAADSVIGVTLWRLRPSGPSDGGERMIVQEGPGATEWLPERVSSGRTLSEGDRIRMSVEAARPGYLYVVNQELYADGSKGEPYLIFPTTRTRGGDNKVAASRVIELPSQDDSPPYFTLKRSRTDHVGESVVVLVAPAPIEGLTINDKAQRLPAETLASWEKLWGARTGRLEMAGGEGRPWTKQERDAGADATRALGEDEPAPQTIYYRPGVGSNSPVLIRVQLQYAKPGTPVRKRR